MDAFVSHSSEDADFASRLVEVLEANGISCWIAPRNIPPGGDYALEIIDAIKASSCVALIFTQSANDSPHVLREVERAVAYRRPVVPLRLQGISPTGSLDYLLATLQWASGCGLNTKEALDLFSQAVRSALEIASNRMPAQPPLTIPDRSEAHEKLWQLCRDIEIGYRRAIRETYSDDQWTALDARGVALNEFLIANSRHFPRVLRTAADGCSRRTAELGRALRAVSGSDLANDFASTRSFSDSELDEGLRLAQLVADYEQAQAAFEQHFEDSSRMPKH